MLLIAGSSFRRGGSFRPPGPWMPGGLHSAVIYLASTCLAGGPAPGMGRLVIPIIFLAGNLADVEFSTMCIFLQARQVHLCLPGSLGAGRPLC